MQESDPKAWRQALAEKLGRAFTLEESRQLAAIEALAEEFEWREALYAKDLEAFDPEIKLKVPEPARPVSDGLWTRKPQEPLELLQYIAFVLLRFESVVPPFLEPIVDTTPIERELLDRAREKESKLWKNRLGNLSQRKFSLPASSLEIRLKLYGRTLKWEGRGSSADPFEVITAKDFGQWLAKGYGFLERFAPESMPLCALFQEYYKATQRARLDLEKPEDAAFLNKLIHHPSARQQIVGSDDQALKRSERRLCWTGVDNGIGDDGCYLLELQLEGGSAAPAQLTYLAGEKPLYLHENALYEGPHLLRPHESPNTPFRIPAAALEAPEGLLFLRNHRLPMPASAGEGIVCVPMQARLYLSIARSEDQWSKKNYLECRLYSFSPDQKHWFLLDSEGWQAAADPEVQQAAPAPAERTLFEQPPSDYASEVLEAFDLDDQEGIWSKLIDKDFPSEFIEWIRSLPEEIQLVPDDEVDTLVDGRPAGRFALSVSSEDGSDWFNLKLDPQFTDTTLSAQERDLVMRAGGDYAYLPGKGWKRFETEVERLDRNLLDTRGVRLDANDTARQTLHTLQLADAKLEDTAFDALAEGIRKRSKELSSKTTARVPKGIRSELRPYQVEGFKFLAFLAHNQFGGILADDMGLGKTLQTLSWLTWLKLNLPASEPRFRALVVCPKSVTHVWRKEVETHASVLKISLYDPESHTAASWQQDDADLLVANYSQLRGHRELFHQVDWNVAVLDEAQYIKNPSSQTAKAARELKARHRIALTGTPVENRATDLWSLFAFAMPGLLGSKASFARQYREGEPQTPGRLARRVSHFMLRRTKKQVATDLPDRIEETLVCQMEGEQRSLYAAELKLAQQSLLRIDSADDFQRGRFNILSSLLRLRQICCHPALISPEYASARSAKLESLLDLVAELREEGHKVLIFSQFVKMLNIISGALEKQDCPHLMLTGQSKNREELVDQFQSDQSKTAFLLSLKAAGSGLNLTAASYVVLYDPWWNPAVEAQAIDRTHRIGQRNTVNAYRLIAKDSIEQKIQTLQVKKESLANEVVREETLSNILDLENLRRVLAN